MDLLKTIRRAAEGAELAPEERELLRNYDPAAERRELEAKLKEYELRALPENERARKQLEGELENLRRELAGVSGERDDIRGRLDALNFRRGVEGLARDAGFSDPDYLEYLCRKSGVAPDGGGEAAEFVSGLRDKYPRFFKVELRPGAATPPAAATGGAATPAVSIEQMLADAPGVEPTR